MKTISKNHANLLILLIMVQAMFLFSCGEGDITNTCHMQDNGDGTNTIVCGDRSIDIRDGVDGVGGRDGNDGKDGADGKDGEKGDKGDQGDQGDQGNKGDKGSSGAPGAPGADGDKGDDGEKGDDGKNGDPASRIKTCPISVSLSFDDESDDEIRDTIFESYDYTEKFCQTVDAKTRKLMDLCGGRNGKVYISTQFCQDSTNAVKQRCGNRLDSTGTYLELEFCQAGTNAVKPRCGDRLDTTGTYKSTEFCQIDSHEVLALCNGTETYLAGQDCQVGRIMDNCAGEWFNKAAMQRCNEEESIVEDKCGDVWYNYKSVIATEYCSNGAMAEYGTMIDDRDDKIYKTVKIGEQTWMAENLNYETEEGSVCYDKKEANCNIYGRLYSFVTATGGAPTSNANPSGVIGVCPEGWHLPSIAEATQLSDYVNSFVPASMQGKKLRARNGWTITNNLYFGTDDFGFAALPGGKSTNAAGTSFYYLGAYAFFATSTFNSSYVGGIMLLSSSNTITISSASTMMIQSDWFSVRCVKDLQEGDSI